MHVILFVRKITLECIDSIVKYHYQLSTVLNKNFVNVTDVEVLVSRTYF